MSGLWTVVNGEPFMENPHLGILNSPRKKRRGGKAMARKHGRSHMAWVRSFKKNKRRSHGRRRYRRNSYPLAGIVANKRRRRYRRNSPGGGERGTSIFGLRLPPVQTVLYTGSGLIGTPLVEGLLNRYLPVSLTSNALGKYAVRIGAVLGLAWAAKMFLGRDAARAVGIGGGAYVVVQAFREFAPAEVKSFLGMSAYSSMGAYSPMGRLMASGSGMGAPAWGAQNTVDSAGEGGSNIVSARFRRFQ